MDGRFFISLLSFIIISTPAFADLGGKLHSGKNHRQIKSSATYTVHEFELNGSTIHEYLSQGKVFAVTWTGRTHPDLSKLIGEYADEYTLALNQSSRMRGQRAQGQVKGEHVVVEKSGHMRAMVGRAYLPLEMPNGVSLNEIK